GFATGNALPLGSVVTFGGQLAATQSVNPLVVQAPASSVAGPVDLVITQPDGETEVEPQEFSYGVDVAAATASLAPPIGNPTLVLFGFGMLNCDCAPPHRSGERNGGWDGSFVRGDQPRLSERVGSGRGAVAEWHTRPGQHCRHRQQWNRHAEGRRDLY